MRRFIVLKPGKEKSVLKRHPWIFSGAIAHVGGSGNQDEPVSILSYSREFLAWADYNPHSQISARIWSWEESQVISEEFIHNRIEEAIIKRQKLKSSIRGMEGDSFRLVYSESDGLPGLIVDQYRDTLVVQFLTAGIENWRRCVINSIVELTKITQIYERSDVDVRKLEGLPLQKGVLLGNEPGGLNVINENNLRYYVDVCNGHKTGFYLDQRLNRLLVSELVYGKDVLDCFCYSGGFTCAAVAGKARSVQAVDSSIEALELVSRNLVLNGLGSENVVIQPGDVFQLLRKFRDRRDTFDTIILDPPKFASSQSQVGKAARGYKDINLLALKLLRPGGMLVTFSCSGNIDEALFQKIIAGAALDAKVQAQVLHRLGQSPDHPMALNLPESAYLKGFLIQVGEN